MERQPTEWEKVFANEVILISKIYQQLMHLTIKQPNQKMSRRSKQTFLQRRHTNGQEAYEKMLNICNYQINKQPNQKMGRRSKQTFLQRRHMAKKHIKRCSLSPIIQLSSVAQSCPTLCDPMNRSTPGLPVHHRLPEFTQTHVHRRGDAIQPSHPLSSPSPPAPNPSQHQGLFQ